jgi:leader peptidase (prepilin peptidase)/N-methyltransferase
MTASLAIAVIVAGVGLCFGSYVATAALRWSAGRQSTFGRSSCDHCGVQLSFARTAPVLSYISQRGSCFACGGPIDGAHPFGELAGAVILVTAFAAASPLRAGLLSLLGLFLLAVSVCDARTRRLPDSLTLAIAVTGAMAAALRSWESLLVGGLCAAVAFLCLEGLRRLYLKSRGRPGLGFGDVKLVAAIALWTGPETPWVVVIGAVLGLAAAKVRAPVDGRLAFGPYLAAAAWIVGICIEARLWPTLA